MDVKQKQNHVNVIVVSIAENKQQTTISFSIIATYIIVTYVCYSYYPFNVKQNAEPKSPLKEIIHSNSQVLWVLSSIIAYTMKVV